MIKWNVCQCYCNVKNGHPGHKEEIVTKKYRNLYYISWWSYVTQDAVGFLFNSLGCGTWWQLQCRRFSSESLPCFAQRNPLKWFSYMGCDRVSLTFIPIETMGNITKVFLFLNRSARHWWSFVTRDRPDKLM